MSLKKFAVLIIVLAGAGGLGWNIYERLEQQQPEKAAREKVSRIIPVEVKPILQNTRIQQIRTFTGTINANHEFVVASKVSGRVEEITVDLADTINRGQIVARIDNAEYRQALTQSQADLAVARANLAEAQSLLKIAEREYQRIDTLQQRGVSSEAEQDTAEANQLARAAHLDVTRAQVTRATAAVETARIRLGYSDVIAQWQGGNDLRIVAERFIDEGQSVNINEPLLRIVELDTVIAVFHVTERDYGLLTQGQTVAVDTDAYAGEVFQGHISRIAPVFRESTRQARVELKIDNPGHKLKPGMFARVNVILESIANATLVPESALVKRGGENGIFVLDQTGASVHWKIVQPGIRQDHRLQLIDSNLDGKVVTLGQQLLEDGSRVVVSVESPE
jgi:RND family efflux transporter MFP subunit